LISASTIGQFCACATLFARLLRRIDRRIPSIRKFPAICYPQLPLEVVIPNLDVAILALSAVEGEESLYFAWIADHSNPLGKRF
jgi:hypothetical protein